MDVALPIRAVIPTLEGPVLVVLARTTRPLTGREIHRLAETGSVNGIRIALGRLTDQGIVTAEERGAAVFYTANREHVAWPAVQMLAELRHTLRERLREQLRTWSRQPLHASLFGSAARGTGDAESDIDILLVRPEGTGGDTPDWAEQVDQLRRQVERWTGNRCHLFQLDLERLGDHARAHDRLIYEWRRDAITLAGDDPRTVLQRVGGNG